MFKVAVCDDNKEDIVNIEKLLDIYSSRENVKFSIFKYSDSAELFKEKDFFDIYFLDVEMPEFSGLELARSINEHYPDPIIFFITNYENYLDEAFDIPAFRYLYKPIDEERFFNGLKLAIQKINKASDGVVLKVMDKRVKVLLDRIIYITIENRFCKVVTTDNEILADDKLNNIYKMLPENKFVYSHKSYIVNLSFVKSYDSASVILKHKDKQYTVHISRRMAREFKRNMILYARGAL